MGSFGLLEERVQVSTPLWRSSSANRCGLLLTGTDMVATYVRENFDPKIAEYSLTALDVEPTSRGQFYI